MTNHVIAVLRRNISLPYYTLGAWKMECTLFASLGVLPRCTPGGGACQGDAPPHRLPRPTVARLRSTDFLARPRQRTLAGAPWPLENPKVRLRIRPATRRWKSTGRVARPATSRMFSIPSGQGADPPQVLWRGGERGMLPSDPDHAGVGGAVRRVQGGPGPTR